MEGDILEFFCRHLIGICWYEGRLNDNGEFTDEPTFYGASGFLLQLYDDLPGSIALITAGHVFTDYHERMAEPQMGATQHSLFDIWGPHSSCEHRIPFNLFEYPVFYIYEKTLGFDFAVVHLPILVKRSLAQSTIPFTKTNWVHQSGITFDYYAMLGLPNEDAVQFTDNKNNLKSIATVQNPALLFLNPCNLPSEITPSTNPQFVAKIDDRVDLKSIVGMSGGPIFGFRRSENGQIAYWPVAIQSRWLPGKRIVIGSFVAPIAAEIEQCISRESKSGNTESK